MKALFATSCSCGHGRIRIGSELEQYGDPYEFMLYIEHRPDRAAWIEGLYQIRERWTLAHRSALKDCLKSEGFLRYGYERRSGDKSREFWGDL
jgi:hypothetical protein